MDPSSIADDYNLLARQIRLQRELWLIGIPLGFIVMSFIPYGFLGDTHTHERFSHAWSFLAVSALLGLVRFTFLPMIFDITAGALAAREAGNANEAKVGFLQRRPWLVVNYMLIGAQIIALVAGVMGIFDALDEAGRVRLPPR